jgi:hypothetical protein
LQAAQNSGARTHLALTIFRRTAAEVAAEDAGKVIAVGEAAIGGDLLDGAVGEGKELRGVFRAGLLHVEGGRRAGVLLEPADKNTLAHHGAAGEDGIGEIAGELAVQEAQHVIEPLRCLGRDGNLERGESAVQQRGGVVIEMLAGERGIGGRARGDDAFDQGPKQRRERERSGSPGKSAGRLQRTEVQPQVRRARCAHAIEWRGVGDEQQAVGLKWKGLVAEMDVAAGRAIVIKAPEGAEHAGMVPVRAAREIAALVDGESGEAEPWRVAKPHAVLGEGGLVTAFGAFAGHGWGRQWDCGTMG